MDGESGKGEERGGTGNREAEGVGVGGEEAFEDCGFPGAGGAGDDDRAVELGGFMSNISCAASENWG